MIINYKETNADSEGPCIEILHETFKEAFQLGELASQIWTNHGCAWRIDAGLRIAIFNHNELKKIREGE